HLLFLAHCDLCHCFFLSGSRAPRPLHSFPTRRSSDLAVSTEPRGGGDLRRARNLGSIRGPVWFRIDLDDFLRVYCDDGGRGIYRSEEHTSELQSRENLVCRLLLEKKKKKKENN